MPMQKLKEFLDLNRVKYVLLRHSPAYTAQEIAASAHIPGKELAKTVMIKVEDQIAMCVLPASQRVDFDLLRAVTGKHEVKLAHERDFEDLFPGCELGAMPPFGNLYDMPVYVTEDLTKDDEIAFNAGSHTELIRLHYTDFERLVRPLVLHPPAGATV